MAGAESLPTVLITGFLGSGKTTLLNGLLRHPGMADTAVIINEFGEVGLDHLLIETAFEDAVLLKSGCICCTVRGDLVDTMGSLADRRAKGEIPPFSRVAIETTGLADPAPILHTIMGEASLKDRYRVDRVIATVDAANALDTLERHYEAAKQAAIADRLVLTKTDLVSGDMRDAVLARLHALNPLATVAIVVNGAVDPDVLFAPDPPEAALRRERHAAAHAHGHAHGHDHEHGHDHDQHEHEHEHSHDEAEHLLRHHGISTVSLVRDGAGRMAEAQGVADRARVLEGAEPFARERDHQRRRARAARGDPRGPACVPSAGRAQGLAGRGPADASCVHHPEYRGRGARPVLHCRHDRRGEDFVPLKTDGAAPELQIAREQPRRA